MEIVNVVNSITIGAALCGASALLWLITAYLRRKTAVDRSKPAMAIAAKVSFEEKRQHPRVAISWVADLETTQGAIPVLLRDISLGGAFVVCPKPLQLNEKCHITIHAPNQESLLLNAEVVWSNANVPDDKVITRGMGIRFAQNSEEDRMRLSNAITASSEDSEE